MKVSDLIIKALSVKYGDEVESYSENTYTYNGCCGVEVEKEVTIYFKTNEDHGKLRGWVIYAGSLESLIEELEVPE